MEIKNKKGFITIYVLISMIFLITLITIVLMMASRKINNQSEINSVIYKMYNSENISNLKVDNITEIPVYTKEQFEYMQNFIGNEEFQGNGFDNIEYININGVIYKLDYNNREQYKISLQTDLEYNLHELYINIEDKVILNEHEIRVSGLQTEYTIGGLSVTTYQYGLANSSGGEITEYATSIEPESVRYIGETSSRYSEMDKENALYDKTTMSTSTDKESNTTTTTKKIEQVKKEVVDGKNVYNPVTDSSGNEIGYKIEYIQEKFIKEVDGNKTTTIRYTFDSGNYEYDENTDIYIPKNDPYKYNYEEITHEKNGEETEITKKVGTATINDDKSFILGSTTTDTKYARKIGTKTEDVKITIPKGFALVDTDTGKEKPLYIDFENGKTVEEEYNKYFSTTLSNDISQGVVIQDTSNNQFVWIPVNNINDMVICQSATGKNGECNIKCDESTNYEPKCVKEEVEYNNDVKKIGHDSTELAGKLYYSDQWFFEIGNNVSAIQTIDLTKTNQKYNSEYREPFCLTQLRDKTFSTLNGKVLNFNQQLEQIEFNKMVKSVIEYGGFYVGRYETGGFEPNQLKAVVKAGEDYISTSGRYDTGKTEEVNGIEKNIYAHANLLTMIGVQREYSDYIGDVIWKGSYEKNYTEMDKSINSVGSSLIWGCQWDQVLKFVNLKKDDNGDIFDINKVNNKRHRNISSKDVAKLRTGDTWNGKNDKVANIYDLEGNMWERTLETADDNKNILRGGTYSATSYRSAANRRYTSNIDGGDNIGSRMTLYIKQDEESE